MRFAPELSTLACDAAQPSPGRITGSASFRLKLERHVADATHASPVRTLTTQIDQVDRAGAQTSAKTAAAKAKRRRGFIMGGPLLWGQPRFYRCARRRTGRPADRELTSGSRAAPRART